MKKSKFLLLMSATALTAGVLGSAALLSRNNDARFEKVGATNLVSHSITLNASHLINVDEYYGTFDLKRSNATYCGEDFESYYDNTGDHSYAYGDELEIGKSGHIFSASGVNEYYASDSVGFRITFLFNNVAEYSSIVLNGKFYYDEQLTNPETTIEYESKDIDDVMFIQHDNLYAAVLDSIVITYKCRV